MECYICKNKKLVIKNNRTRDNNHLKVLHCSNCSLTCLESFDHLKTFSYVDSENNYEKIILSKTDYQALLKTLKIDDSRRFNLWKKIIKNKTVLDFGSGAGGFLKLAKKVAKKVVGVELDSIARFYNKEIEIKKSIEEFEEKFDIITLFHVLEHIYDPIVLLKNLKKYLKPGGKIIIEVPNDDDALISYYKSQAFKDFTYWSLHLYSYNQKTLRAICRRAGFKIVTTEFFQRYSLSNHIGWLKDGKPGGHEIYKEFNDFKLNYQYVLLLKKLGICDTLIAVLNV